MECANRAKENAEDAETQRTLRPRGGTDFIPQESGISRAAVELLMVRLTLTAFVVALLLLTLALQSQSARNGFVEWSNEVIPPQGTQSSTTTPKLEGCVSCHGQIEPMHKYGTTETLDKLKDGKDAVGLSCTACHGGCLLYTSPSPRDS